MFKRLNKREAVVLVGLMIGIAWVFFILGMIYTTYDHIRLLSNIQIKEMTLEINESKLVDYSWEKAKEYYGVKERLKELKNEGGVKDG